MTALYDSPFLIALGWTIVSSLWQTALLWLAYQLAANMDKRNTPALRHNLAVLATGISFCWFGVTFVQNYSEIIHLAQSAAALSALSEEITKTLSATHISTSRSNVFELLSTYLPYFSAAYLLVLFILLAKLVNAYLFSRKMRTKGLRDAAPQWVNYVNRYAAKLGIKRKVNIFFSEYVNVPATLDFFKPVILIPVAAFNQLTPKQVESVLLHELAHIRRNDYLINILVSVAETILFFNPFIHLLGKSIRKEREHCCDDLVLHFNTDAHSYASALLSLEKMRIGIQPIALAATGNDNQLLSRVKRIMNVNTTNFNYGQKLFAFVCIAFFLISLAWLSPDQHINRTRSRREHTDAKIRFEEDRKEIMGDRKKIIVIEKTATPTQRVNNVFQKTVIQKENPENAAPVGISPLPSLPAAPNAMVPPASPQPPAFTKDFEGNTVTYHLEAPTLAAEEFMHPNDIEWSTEQNKISNTPVAEPMLAPQQLLRQAFPPNEKLRMFDPVSATTISGLLKQAKEQQLLNDRQIEIIIQQQLNTLQLRQEQLFKRDRDINKKSIDLNRRRTDSNLQKQEGPLRKKAEKPSLWI